MLLSILGVTAIIIVLSLCFCIISALRENPPQPFLPNPDFEPQYVCSNRGTGYKENDIIFLSTTNHYGAAVKVTSVDSPRSGCIMTYFVISKCRTDKNSVLYQIETTGNGKGAEFGFIINPKQLLCHIDNTKS
jgi:hypothetical protein